MNPHLKLAYEHGVRTALQEAGITKTAEGFGAEVTLGDLVGKHTPESRESSRALHQWGYGLPAFLGGGIGTMLAAAALTKGRNIGPRARENLVMNTGVLGGLGSGILGGLAGTEASMEKDPALMRYLRGTRRAVGLE